MNPIAIRLLSQQLVAPQFSDPAEVVSYMGAMQAQEYRMMRWAVEMRLTRWKSTRPGKHTRIIVGSNPSWRRTSVP